MRLFVGSAAVLVLVFATACGGGSTPAGSSGGDNPGANPSDAAQITPPPPTAGIAGAPTSCDAGAATGGAVITLKGTHDVDKADVTIKAGESVTWTNSSSTNHQIVVTGAPKCPFTLIGKSVSMKFPGAGVFNYVDSIYPTYIKGTITVQ